MSKTNSKQHSGKIALVTGATSGMGRTLIEVLLAEKYEVRVLLRKNPNEHVEWKELPSGVKIYVADIRFNTDSNMEVMMEACGGVTVLFHLAAATYSYSSRYSSEKIDTNLMINTNVIGTENILQAYADANVDKKLRLIYASSIAVYGYKRGGEVLSEDSEPAPKNAYGESKYMAEQVIKAFGAANKKLSYTIFRIGVVYGDGYDSSFLRIFRLIKEKRLRYVGKGENHLTLINVDDVTAIMMKSVSIEKSANRIYNLTDGVPYTQKELFKKAAKLLNTEAPTKTVHPLLARIGARARGIGGDEFEFLVSDRVVSIERAKRELGFKPKVSIDTGGRAIAKIFLASYKAK